MITTQQIWRILFPGRVNPKAIHTKEKKPTNDSTNIDTDVYEFQNLKRL